MWQSVMIVPSKVDDAICTKVQVCDATMKRKDLMLGKKEKIILKLQMPYGKPIIDQLL